MKTYNTGHIPFVAQFDGDVQLSAEICNADDKKVLTLNQPAAQENARVFYPNGPDIFLMTDVGINTLPPGRYYADIKFRPEEKTAYRIFFDIEI